ncbi:MAG: cyclase [Burkholderiaceae bacterium]|nr:MAG: cyclase [Burkholderiaceae bacterium]
MSWIYLSHVLSASTPLYGGIGQVCITQTRAISEGHSCNSSDLALPAHAGTHIDAPCHFDAAGVGLDVYPPDFWLAERPWLLDIPCRPGDVLDCKRVEDALITVPMECDLLLLRTGAEDWRNKSPKIYAEQGPGVAADVGRWLRRNRRIKFLGMDFISLSSFAHRELGREAHRAFLGPDHENTHPILLVEDMALSQLERAPSSVWIVPLRYVAADGAPVTVMAQL